MGAGLGSGGRLEGGAGGSSTEPRPDRHPPPPLGAQGLLPLLEAAPEGGRVVVVSSETHREVSTGYNLQALEALCDKRHQVVAYEHSKLCNLLFAAELARRVRKAGVGVFACCPGFVDTGLRRHLAATPAEQELFDMLYASHHDPSRASPFSSTPSFHFHAASHLFCVGSSLTRLLILSH